MQSHTEAKDYIDVSQTDLAESHNPGVKELRENAFFITPPGEKSSSSENTVLFKDFKRGQIRFAINFEKDGKPETTFITYENLYQHFNYTQELEPKLLPELKSFDDVGTLKTALKIAYSKAGINISSAEFEKKFSEIEHAYCQKCISIPVHLLRDALESVSLPGSILKVPAADFYQGTIYLNEEKLVARDGQYSMFVARDDVKSTFARIHKKGAEVDTVIEMKLNTRTSIDPADRKLLQDEKKLHESRIGEITEIDGHKTRHALRERIATLTAQLSTQREFQITSVKTRCPSIREIIRMKNKRIPQIFLSGYDEVKEPNFEEYKTTIIEEHRVQTNGESKQSLDEIQRAALKMETAALQARTAFSKAATAPDSKVSMYTTLPRSIAPVTASQQELPDEKKTTAEHTTPQPKQDAQPKTAAPKRKQPKQTGSVLKAAAWATLGGAIVAGSYVAGGAAFAALSPIISPVGATAVAGGIFTAAVSAGLACAGKAHQQYKTAPAKHKSIAKAIGWGLLGAAIGVASYFGAAAALALSPFISPVAAVALAVGIASTGTFAVLGCADKMKENYDEAKSAKKKSVTIEIPAEQDKQTAPPSPDHSPEAPGSRRPSSINLPSIGRSKSSDSVSSMTVETDFSSERSALANLSLLADGRQKELKEPLLPRSENGNTPR